MTKRKKNDKQWSTNHYGYNNDTKANVLYKCTYGVKRNIRFIESVIYCIRY